MSFTDFGYYLLQHWWPILVPMLVLYPLAFMAYCRRRAPRMVRYNQRKRSKFHHPDPRKEKEYELLRKRVARIMKHPCCDNCCLDRCTFHKLFEYYERLYSKEQSEKRQFLVEQMAAHRVDRRTFEDYRGLACTIGGEHYLFSDLDHHHICLNAWLQINCDVARSTLYRLQQHARNPNSEPPIIPETSKPTMKQVMASFLEMLKTEMAHHDPVHEVFYLQEWMDKKQVYYEFFVPHYYQFYLPDNPDCENLPLSPNTFYRVWQKDFRDLLPRNLGPVCKTCQEYMEKKSNIQLSAKVRMEAQHALDSHREFVQKHLGMLNAKRAFLNASRKALVIGGDYKEGIKVIKLHPAPAAITMQSAPKYLVGGYAYWNGQRHTASYYIHTSNWSESTNSVISSLHHLLLNWKGERPKELWLIFDNHSTNKNFTMLAYCYWLCRYARLFEEVVLVFSPPYHGKNFVDQAHQGVAAEQKATPIIYSLNQMVEVARKAKGRNFKAHALTDIWDWQGFFQRDLKLPPSVVIGDCTHTALCKDFLVFKSTYNGMQFKESLVNDYAWSPSYSILGGNPSKEPGERRERLLQRAPPKLFQTTIVNGRTVKDPEEKGLAAILRHAKRTFPDKNYSWVDSLLDQTWDALSRTEPRSVFPEGYNLRANRLPIPINHIHTLVAGQYTFLRATGDLCLVRIINPHTHDPTKFRGKDNCSITLLD